MSDLRDWDMHTAPTLRLIEALGIALEMRAGQLERALSDLPSRPAFVAKAETALEDADARITHALQCIRLARKHYRDLPHANENLQAAE